MARPQKRGVDYFPFDVGFFDDRKIKELRGKFGADGVTLYIYLLCQIYNDKGYYMQLDEGFTYVMSADLNMDSDKIGLIINFLCKRSLFDDTLFTSDKVLTSHGIQMRFQECVKTRAQKTEITVNKNFWILKKEETKGYIKVAHFDDFSENNSCFSENNPNFSIEKPHKEKKSKVKESKVKEYMAADKPPARPRFKKPTVDDIQKYCEERKNGINAQYFWDYYEARGWKVGGKTPMKDWKASIRTWENNGYSAKSKKQSQKADFEQRQYTDAELEEKFKNKNQ